MTRGMKKIKELLDGIKNEEYKPNPSPLCHWCTYCATNPNQPKDPNAHNRCPYHSLWTKEKESYAVANKWEGMAKHKEILENYIKNSQKSAV